MAGPTEEITIRELNLEMIAPSTKTMYIDKQGGSKTIVLGKPGCFAPGTKVLMFNGNIKPIETIKVGDVVMGDDSSKRTVLELCHNYDQMYHISSTSPLATIDYTVNKDHILVLYSATLDKQIEITVQNLINKYPNDLNNFKLVKTHVDFDYKQLDYFPYFVGNIVGSASIEIKHKIIPPGLKYNIRKYRLEFLAGLIDKSGYHIVSKNQLELSLPTEALANEVAFISNSVGFATATDYSSIQTTNNESSYNIYKVYISGKLDEIPSTHFVFTNQPLTQPKYHEFKITHVGMGEYFGFILDNNHRFLLDSCDVVHNTGKSTLITSLIYYKKHIFPTAMVMSGSEDSNHSYAQFIPNTFIYNEYNENKIIDFIKRQKIAKAHLPNPWAILLIDDCTDDPSIFNKKIQQNLFKIGRHYKMWYILSLQYAMDIKPVIRTNVDGIFILRESQPKFRKVIWENYAGIIPDFKLFCSIMDEITDDFTALYIHNATQTNKWQDCVFWYKASGVPGKITNMWSPEVWKFHEIRYNKAYVDPV